MPDIYHYTVPSDANPSDMRLSDPTVPASPSSYYAILKKWTGTIWQKIALGVYNGSFQALQVDTRVGAAWQSVDTTGV